MFAHVTTLQWILAGSAVALWAAWELRHPLAAAADRVCSKLTTPGSRPAATVLLPAALAAAILFGPQLVSRPAASTLPPMPAPAADLQAVTKPLAAKAAAEDRPDLAAFFAAGADILTRDQGATVKTAEHLAAIDHAALNLMFARKNWGAKYNDLAAAIGEAEGRHLGIYDEAKKTNRAGPIDAATVAKAAAFCSALAWAFQQ